MFTSLCLIAALGTSDAERDHTGIQWVLPFDATLKKAQVEQRLLLIKPIAFGTSKDGGW
jgi:hypothetical protein